MVWDAQRVIKKRPSALRRKGEDTRLPTGGSGKGGRKGEGALISKGKKRLSHLAPSLARKEDEKKGGGVPGGAEGEAFSLPSRKDRPFNISQGRSVIQHGQDREKEKNGKDEKILPSTHTSLPLGLAGKGVDPSEIRKRGSWKFSLAYGDTSQRALKKKEGKVNQSAGGRKNRQGERSEAPPLTPSRKLLLSASQPQRNEANAQKDRKNREHHQKKSKRKRGRKSVSSDAPRQQRRRSKRYHSGRRGVGLEREKVFSL